MTEPPPAPLVDTVYERALNEKGYYLHIRY